MKHVYITILLFLISYTFHSQIVNIPDANFKNALLNHTPVIDTNGDGEIQVIEAESVMVLDVSGSQISSLEGIEAFINLESLNCALNYLTSLNLTGLSNLLTLTANGNDLTSMNISTLTSLASLNCSGNQLTSIDLDDQINLTSLNLAQNEISSLNLQTLTSLNVLSVWDNNLTNLDVSSLAFLETLFCEYNQLESITFHPNVQLEYLAAIGNLLTSFDFSIFSNTAYNYADLSYNNLTDVDFSGASNLTFDTLNLSDNDLDMLSLNIGDSNYIIIDNNPLQSLIFGDNIESINQIIISNTDITDLEIRFEVGNMYVSNNINLETINFKNGYLTSSNDYISMPNNPSLTYVCADFDEISIIEQKLIDDGYSLDVIEVNSYCTFVPGGNNFNVTGQVRLDINDDGCNASDPVFPNLKFNVIDGNGINTTYYADDNGFYNIPVNENSFTVTPVFENDTYWTASPNSFTVSFPSDSSPYVQDICVTTNNPVNDLDIAITPITSAVPGFTSTYKLTYSNKGNTTLTGSVSFNYDDNYMDFVSSIPMPNSQTSGRLSNSTSGCSNNNSSGQLVYNFENLSPLETLDILISLTFNTPTDPDFPVTLGQIIDLSGIVNPVEDDETPSDNCDTLYEVVVNSSDPNDKVCHEGPVIAEEQVGDYVHYTIRFENLGTANAINVVIVDFIDINKFDINSLVPIEASHDFTTKISNVNMVEFIFENINLPFEDANNDGHVTFKIKTLPTLTIGETFSNDAEIYFDFNAPVVTNDYQTLIENNLGIQNYIMDDVHIYPNPVTDIVNIAIKNSIDSIQIYDLQGKIVQDRMIRESISEVQLDISEFNSGVYFLRIVSQFNSKVYKIIKL